MRSAPRFTAWLRGCAAALLLTSLTATGHADPVWQESYNIASSLDNNGTYASNAATRTATVSYQDQVATNTSGSTRHLGMYLGWAWSYDGTVTPTPTPTPLLWNNAAQAFVGGDVSLQVSGGTGSLLLSSIVNDTWIGTLWAPGSEPGIATVGNWVVPFFDFGEIAAGASVTYDIELTFTFATDAAWADWDRAGSFYLGGQGVERLPEPGSLALAAVALTGLAWRRRRVG